MEMLYWEEEKIDLIRCQVKQMHRNNLFFIFFNLICIKIFSLIAMYKELIKEIHKKKLKKKKTKKKKGRLRFFLGVNLRKCLNRKELGSY